MLANDFVNNLIYSLILLKSALFLLLLKFWALEGNKLLLLAIKLEELNKIELALSFFNYFSYFDISIYALFSPFIAHSFSILLSS